MKVTNDILYVGVNDHQVDLFEGQYHVPNGMAYNSYVIMDEKIAVMDTVDVHFEQEWLENVEAVLNGHQPDYLIIQHMEPDHAGNISNFMKRYPNTAIVANEKTFVMMDQFFDLAPSISRIAVENFGTLCLGKHTLTFVYAPMVHWPEVMVTYDSTDKVLFSADGFGKFGANDVDEPWADEARRYFIGIVGKYGPQVQALLKVAGSLDISVICPTHGPVLSENLGYYIGLYDKWSSYSPEEDGVLIAYTSVYGNTRKAALLMAEKLSEKGCPKVVVKDLARDDMAEAISDAFRYRKLVLATTTYNADIFPQMHAFLHGLRERNFQNRTVAFIENGTWAPQAMRVMKSMLSSCKNLTFPKNHVTIWSSLKENTMDAIDNLASELCMDYTAQSSSLANKQNMSALFKIGYGLYVITARDGSRVSGSQDTGMVCNTVTQLTDSPNRVAVNINKRNYTHDVVKLTGKMNVNCLSVEAPFWIFQKFGFQSGRDVDKFADMKPFYTDNGLAFLPEFINGVISLEVESYVDLGTHGMFICRVTEARVLSDQDTMTYTYYQEHVKPRPESNGKKGWVCKVCGYIYEGDELPEDIVCPLCKHGALDFEPIG